MVFVCSKIECYSHSIVNNNKILFIYRILKTNPEAMPRKIPCVTKRDLTSAVDNL